MIKNTNMVILTDVPFGLGNIQNLEAAIEATKWGIPTYVVNGAPINERDFTHGKAVRLMQQLKEYGAIFVKNQIELVAILKNKE
jgi:iron complex transport system ATP-binding protein